LTHARFFFFKKKKKQITDVVKTKTGANPRAVVSHRQPLGYWERYMKIYDRAGTSEWRRQIAGVSIPMQDVLKRSVLNLNVDVVVMSRNPTGTETEGGM
jgi:hypothetical protein